jgi:hypothetical protein
MATTATTASELLLAIDTTIRSQTAPNSITPITHSDLLDNVVRVLSGTTIDNIFSGTTSVESLLIRDIGSGTSVTNLGFDVSGNIVTGTTGVVTVDLTKISFDYSDFQPETGTTKSLSLVNSLSGDSIFKAFTNVSSMFLGTGGTETVTHSITNTLNSGQLTEDDIVEEIGLIGSTGSTLTFTINTISPIDLLSGGTIDIYYQMKPITL